MSPHPPLDDDKTAPNMDGPRLRASAEQGIEPVVSDETQREGAEMRGPRSGV